MTTEPISLSSLEPPPPATLAPSGAAAQSAFSMLLDPTPESPHPFGRYQLMRRIGAGGMGEVFLARESGDKPRACVVKKVLPNLVANRAFVGRFLDEAKVVVRLKHQNIARVYAMGDVDGEYFLTMEYVQGKTVSRLTKRLREKNLDMPIGLALLIAERVCEGLHYAHQSVDERGESLHLVHRDLSPANVCISYDGHVKIIDFGAAQSTLKNEQTAPRVVIGNLTYMSPEQARKQPVDGRADIYSCGVLLWELLAWFALPQKGDPIERWRKAANPVWEAPSTNRPGLPRDIDDLVLKALSKDANDRYPTAGAFAEALLKARKRHAPDVNERDLSELISRVFASEKRAEDAMLSETVYGRTVIHNATRVAVPVTAMAFEHTIVLAPNEYHSVESADPVPDETTDPEKNHPGAANTAQEVTIRHPNPYVTTSARPLRASFGLPLATVAEPVFTNGLTSPGDQPDDELSVSVSVSVNKNAQALPLWAKVFLFGGIFSLAVSLGFLGVWLAMR